MSQINDALRRAGHLGKGSLPPPMPVSAPPPPPPPALPPSILPPPPPLGFAGTEAGEDAPRKSSGVQIVLAVVLVLCVSIAAVFTFLEKRNRLAANLDPTEPSGAKKTLPTEAVKKSLAERQASRPAPTNVPIPTATAPVVVAVPPPPTRPVEPVKFPPLRLQSIFFRPSSPSVMINNKTLYVDDQIQGVLVADIQASSVTLVLSGQTNVLTLR